jgi:hypothetical protein
MFVTRERLYAHPVFDLNARRMSVFFWDAVVSIEEEKNS